METSEYKKWDAIGSARFKAQEKLIIHRKEMERCMNLRNG